MTVPTDPTIEDVPEGLTAEASPLTVAERGTPGFNQLWLVRKMTRMIRQLGGMTATEDEGNFIDNVQPDHANGAVRFTMDGLPYTVTVTRDV